MQIQHLRKDLKDIRNVFWGNKTKYVRDQVDPRSTSCCNMIVKGPKRVCSNTESVGGLPATTKLAKNKPLERKMNTTLPYKTRNTLKYELIEPRVGRIFGCDTED